ncbi:MAG: formyltransferase family protein [Patescibacteria group bacterium]
MRVVVLTSNYHLGANVAVRKFLENPLLKKNGIEVVGIVSAATFSLNRPGFKIMWRFLMTSGLRFFWRTVFVRIWQTVWMKLARFFVPDSRRRYFEMSELAQIHRIPYLAVNRINSARALDFVKKLQPDYLVSALLLQIVKKELLAVPRLGSINFHPALTQQHRGAFTSFWALLNHWRAGGATVHFMTEEVDAGQVILQRRFRIHRSDTLHTIDQRSARLGGLLLAKALVKLQKRGKPNLIAKLGEVFSMPRPIDFSRFRQMGKKIILFRHLFEV